MSFYVTVVAKRYKIARTVPAAVCYGDNVMYFKLSVVNREIDAVLIFENVYLAAVMAGELIAVKYFHCIRAATSVSDRNVV